MTRPDAIAQQLFALAVRIEAASATQSKQGTAFFFLAAPTLSNTNGRVFLVTNRHMVENLNTGTISLTQFGQNGKPIVGARADFVLTNWDHVWFCNPATNIDVAVIPQDLILSNTSSLLVRPPAVATNTTYYCLPIPSTLAISQDELNYLSGAEDVLFAGYPVDVYDATNYLPILRRGIAASPLLVNFQGLPCFVIDAAVFPGSSGSPVFIYSGSGYRDMHGWQTGQRIRFAGIIAMNYNLTEQRKIVLREIPSAWEATYSNSLPLNLGVVLKPEIILQTIDEYYRRRLN